MNSLILSALSRIIFTIMFGVSLFVLYRGHNFPGGGFVGGLVAASGFAVLALANGATSARQALHFHPIALTGCGLVMAIASGLPGLFTDQSYLTHWWLHIGSFHAGTALIFDIGVYLVVIGGIMAMVLRFYEETEA